MERNTKKCISLKPKKEERRGTKMRQIENKQQHGTFKFNDILTVLVEMVGIIL